MGQTGTMGVMGKMYPLLQAPKNPLQQKYRPPSCPIVCPRRSLRRRTLRNRNSLPRKLPPPNSNLCSGGQTSGTAYHSPHGGQTSVTERKVSPCGKDPAEAFLEGASRARQAE